MQPVSVDPAELAARIGELNTISQMVYVVVLLIVVQLIFMGALLLVVRNSGKNMSQDNELQSKHLDTLKDNNSTMLTMVGEFAKSQATFAATIHYWGAERKAIRAMMQNMSKSQADLVKSQAHLAQSYKGLQADVSILKQRIEGKPQAREGD